MHQTNCILCSIRYECLYQRYVWKIWIKF
jgi:hypothetical protein